jgi:hypothetical protein
LPTRDPFSNLTTFWCVKRRECTPQGSQLLDEVLCEEIRDPFIHKP